MRKLNPKAVVLVLATLLNACSNNEVGPSNQAPVQGDVILNSTSESNGNPSPQGWRTRYRLTPFFASFAFRSFSSDPGMFNRKGREVKFIDCDRIERKEDLPPSWRALREMVRLYRAGNKRF